MRQFRRAIAEAMNIQVRVPAARRGRPGRLFCPIPHKPAKLQDDFPLPTEEIHRAEKPHGQAGGRALATPRTSAWYRMRLRGRQRRLSTLARVATRLSHIVGEHFSEGVGEKLPLPRRPPGCRTNRTERTPPAISTDDNSLTLSRVLVENSRHCNTVEPFGMEPALGSRPSAARVNWVGVP